MHYLITGGSGFIGSALILRLLEEGHKVTVLSRQSKSHLQKRFGGSVEVISDLSSINSEDLITGIINLAGEPIADKRWSKSRIGQVESSRFKTTQSLVELIDRLSVKPEVFVSGSAVGYYGAQQDLIVSEDTRPHPEFTHELCQKWEAIAEQAKQSTRVCLLRTGLVVGPNGGFLKKMVLPFSLGLGGKLGSGCQWMPWIHLTDMVNIILHLLNDSRCTGPFNAVAPNPVRNLEFTKTLAHVLRRPALFTTPAFILKVLLGEMSVLLLTGQRAVPAKLDKLEFQFEYEQLQPALESVLNSHA